MAAPDFPASPTVGQIYTAPSGNVYTWDGAVWVNSGAAQSAYWTDTGTALQPTVSTRRVTVAGPTTGTTDLSQLILGTRTVKGRVTAAPGIDWVADSSNAAFGSGSAWTQDDATKASWITTRGGGTSGSGSDSFTVGRVAPGGSTNTTFLTVDSTGAVSIPANGHVFKLGSTILGELEVNGGGTGQVDIATNHPWAPQDATKPSWMLQLDTINDGVNLYRRAPNAAAGTVSNLFSVNNAGNATATGWMQGRAYGFWLGLPGSTIPANSTNAVIPLAAGVYDPYGIINTGANQVIFPANKFVLLWISLQCTQGPITLLINQWNGSAWTTRAAQSYNAATVVGSYSCVLICDTRYGTQFYYGMTNGSGNASVITGYGYVGGFVIGSVP